MCQESKKGCHMNIILSLPKKIAERPNHKTLNLFSNNVTLHFILEILSVTEIVGLRSPVHYSGTLFHSLAAAVH